MIGPWYLLIVKRMSVIPDVPEFRSCAGIMVHAPCVLDSRVRGVYESLLPDGQKEILAWDDGQKKTHYYDGTFPGKCDTILSANTLIVTAENSIDWDFHDLSEPGNNIGHGLGQDNLGLEQCNSRIYTVLLKNWATSQGNLVIGNSASSRWGGFLEGGSFLKLPPNSIFGLVCENPGEGIPVGPGNSNLRLNALGGSVTFGINYNACSV